MTRPKHKAIARATAVFLLLAVWLAWPQPDLVAQSSPAPASETAPPAEDTAASTATEGKPSPAASEKPEPERSRAYRRQKDELKTFTPSEEIRVDKAVDFPADI